MGSNEEILYTIPKSGHYWNENIEVNVVLYDKPKARRVIESRLVVVGTRSDGIARGSGTLIAL
jgi:hypothetical protein